MNPITVLIFYVSLSISVLLSEDIYLLTLHILLVLCIIFYKRNLFLKWKSLIATYWLYLPIIISFFLITSFIRLEYNVSSIIFDAILSVIRLYVLVSIMALYAIESHFRNLVPALKSINYRLEKNFSSIDRLMLFFEISLRFFPTMHKNWSITKRSQNALCLENGNKLISNIITNSKLISHFVLLEIGNSNKIVESMKMRGLKDNCKRSVYPFVDFRFFDFICCIGLLVMIIGVHSIE